MFHRCLRASPIAVVCVLTSLAAFFAAGCESSSPTEPPIAAPSGGAQITGSIVAAAGTIPTSAGTTVRIAGTNNTTTIDANQNFTFTNVPTGTQVTLVFNGTGLDTAVPIGVVNFADHVVLVFARNTTTLTLARPTQGVPSGSSTTLTGRIDSVSTTNRSFTVLGQQFKTDTATQFLRSDGTAATFFDLFVGLFVDVTSVPSTSGSALAKTVKLEDLGTGATVVLLGIITDVQFSGRSFQFIVQGRLVKGDQNTVFDDGFTSAVLRNGVTVQVSGLSRIGFIQATQIRVQ